MTDITANVIVSMPSQLFTMARSFKAVANGKIYIGKIDTDPVNPENRIQVYVENEDGSHVPVSQPIIINAAGYPVYNGQIAKFVTVKGHSMAVYDAYGAKQFYFPNVLKYDPDRFRQELQQTNGSELVGHSSSIVGNTTVYDELERLTQKDKKTDELLVIAGKTFYSKESMIASSIDSGEIVRLVDNGQESFFQRVNTILGNINFDIYRYGSDFLKRIKRVSTGASSLIGSTSPIGYTRFGDIMYERRGNSATMRNDLSVFRQTFSTSPIYVDPVNGDDANGDGNSWLTAYKTLTKAISRNINTIYVRGNTILPWESSLSLYNVTASLNIIAVGGPVYAGCVEQGVWGTGNGLNLFTPTLSGNTPLAVFDTGSFSPKFGYERLKKVNSLSECQSTSSTWFVDASDGYKVYVHTKNGETVYTNQNRISVQYARDPYVWVWSGNHRVYLEGFKFFGSHNIGTSTGAFTVKSDGTFRQGVFYAKNCEFSCAYDANSNGLSALDVGIVITENCIAHSNRRDGFNYHEGASGISPHFIEVNNTGAGNGYLDTSGANNNNGSTSHESCKGVRINCSYSGCRGPAIKDIDESTTYNVAITVHDSIAGFVVTDSDVRPGSTLCYIDGICSFNNIVRDSSAESGDLTANGPSSKMMVRDVITEQPAYCTNSSTIELIS